MIEEREGKDDNDDDDDDDDNNDENEDEDEDEDLWLARGILRASDKFKHHRMRQVLQRVANDVRSAYPEDLTTSDIQNHLEDIVENAQSQADYPIEVYTKIYINKTLVKRRSLPDTTRDNFDLSDIEDNLA
jgi:hypothetical protein